MCAKFRFSISSRCDDIIAEVKGGQLYAPPSGWRVARRPSGCRVNMESQRVNFDGLLLMSGDTHDDENLIGYIVFAPLFNYINDFNEICL